MWIRAASCRPIPSWPLSRRSGRSPALPILRSGHCRCSRRVLGSPLLLELAGRRVPQGGVNAFDVVNVVEETCDLPLSVGEVLVLGEIHLLFFDGADETFGVTVF